MDDLDMLLARSVLYRWAARLFFYPDRVLLESLRSGRALAEMFAAAAHVAPEAGMTEALTVLEQATQTTGTGDVGLDEEYTYLFERNVLCPLYETNYREERSIVLAHDLAEIGGFYAAFGVQVSGTRPERSDHVSLELEFLSFLYAKEAYARERSWSRRAAITQGARRRFVEEHLAVWLASLVERVAQHARIPVYPAAARLAQALVNSEAYSRGVGHEDPVRTRA